MGGGHLFGGKVEASRIGLGTVGFGSDVSRAQAFALLDVYFEHGGNFLDTAHVYASWRPNGAGASERTLGEWIRANGLRDSVVPATKGAHPPFDDMTHGRCGAADIESDLTESLERLGVESVDMYWLHRDDYARPAGEIVETLARIQADGRIGAFGGSNWTWARLEAANAYAQERGLPGMAASQPGWALADRREDTKGWPCMLYLDEPTRRRHVETGLPVVAYTSQAAGWFGEENVRWVRGGFAGEAPRAGRDYDTPENRGRLRRAVEMADRKGCTANQVALAYLLHQPFPVYPLVGTSKVEHLLEALGALDVELEDAECTYLRAGD